MVVIWHLKKVNKKNICSVSKKQYTILQIAKMFKTKIKFLPPREGERMMIQIIMLLNKVLKDIKLI